MTVVSIFVNPAQFAPHEDLRTYPRTLPQDLVKLETQRVTIGNVERIPSAVFVPALPDMYPSGIDQDVARQKGAFVELAGYSHQMEGASRPTFFRGVATVVTKLFNIVQVSHTGWSSQNNTFDSPFHKPTSAYFGQKDIQQALLLRRLCRDLLFAYPPADQVHIVPTERDPIDGLALSSRNAYLSGDERPFAITLYQALQAAASLWTQGAAKKECISAAVAVVEQSKEQAASKEVAMKLDYIDMNDSETFEVLDDGRQRVSDECPVILSGALWVGKTRLIDNIVIGNLGNTSL